MGVNIFMKLRDWGVHVPSTCLYNSQDESRNHPFFNFPYPRALLRSYSLLAEELNYSFWKLNILISTHYPNITLGDLTETWGM